MKILILCLVFVQLVCVCSATADTKSEIESLLIRANEAVSAKNYEKLRVLLVPESLDYKLTQSEWDFIVSDEKRRKVFLHKYPNPTTNCRFLNLKTEAERAIYYCESGLDDPKFQQISAVSFEKKEGGWKFFGRGRISSAARAGGDSARKGSPTWQEQGGMLTAIETDPKFQFDFMFRKQSAKRTN